MKSTGTVRHQRCEVAPREIRTPAPRHKRQLYDAADEYSRLRSNGGFTGSEEMEAARERLLRAARRFVEKEDKRTK